MRMPQPFPGRFLPDLGRFQPLPPEAALFLGRRHPVRSVTAAEPNSNGRVLAASGHRRRGPRRALARRSSEGNLWLIDSTRVIPATLILRTIDDTSSNFQLHIDGGSHFAALSPVIAPTSSSIGIQDFAINPSPFAHNAFTSNALAVHTIGANDATASGSPTDLDSVPGDNTSTVTLNVMEGRRSTAPSMWSASAARRPLRAPTPTGTQVTLDAGHRLQIRHGAGRPKRHRPRLPSHSLRCRRQTLPVQPSTTAAWARPEELRFTATASGTYYISVDNYTAADVGDYTISG